MKHTMLYCSIALMLVLVCACRQASPPAHASRTTATQTSHADPRTEPNLQQRLADAPDPAKDESEIPGPGAGPSSPGHETAREEPILADDCPQPDGAVDAEMAAQASALVPLKPGLTLSTAWHRATESDDVECLTHVQTVDASALAVSANCSMRTGTQGGSRRTCRTDLRGAHMYYTGAGDEPDVLRGTTMFSLSTAAFGELKAKGATPHRYVSLYNGEIIGDLDGVLARDATDSIATIVNDHEAELPVVRASGTLRGTAMGKPLETRVKAAILNDERFPLVLDYVLQDVGATGFAVRYTKISFPTDGKLEERLSSARRIDVYGIYFDFASDRIRTESEPVLREIADALTRNPEWRVTINGHTDGTGGARANMELSQRRSESVRAALVERYGITPERLSTTGYGASVPKDTNDTPQGRARNRRVELVRQ